MRAALYVRLSRDRDGLSTGPDRQLADCRAMAAARVWDVVGEFVDRDVSAYNPHIARPAYEAMITELEAGAVDVIVAWKLDRLLRRPRDFEELWERLEARGASLVTVADGIDSTQPLVGELVPRLMTTFAKLESQNLSMRAKRKHEEIAAAGRRSGGGRRPFGLTADWTEIVQDEAQEIRAAAEAIIVGSASRYSVAVDWNARGIRTSCGNLWTQPIVTAMFRSPRLAGARVYRGELVRSGAIPAILELEMWQVLQAAIGRRTRTPAGRFLLSGLLRCSFCGTVMSGQRRFKDHARFYGCKRLAGRRGCGRINIVAEPLEANIEDRLLAALGGELNTAIRAHEERAAAGDELARIQADQAALAQLADDYYVSQLVGRDEYVALRRTLEGRVRDRRRRLTSRAGTRLVAEAAADPTTTWSRADLTARRQLLSELVEAIEISPASRKGAPFEPNRVTIHWRL